MNNYVATHCRTWQHAAKESKGETNVVGLEFIYKYNI